MATFTLAQLKTLVRQRADIENSQHIQDAELTNYINASISELRGLMIQKFGDEYFLSSTTFPLVNGTADYALPSDFFKLIGVDLQLTPTSDWVTLKRFDFQERNRYSASIIRGVYGAPLLRYHVQGDNINFQPTPTDTNTIRLWYVPTATALSSDSDQFKGCNGWEEYVVIDSAIKCLVKQELDISELVAMKRFMIDRLESEAGKRDANFAPKITDTRRLDFEEFTHWGDY